MARNVYKCGERERECVCVCVCTCAHARASAHKTERKRKKKKETVDGMFNSMECLQYIIYGQVNGKY